MAAGLLFSGSGAAVRRAAPPVTTVWGLVGRDLTAIDAATGKKRWSRPVGSVFATPVVRDGICYVNGTDSVYAFDVASGAVRWHRRVPLAGSSSSVQNMFLKSGVVYAIVAGSGSYLRVYALDAGTGTVRWQVTDFEFDSAQYAGGVLALSQASATAAGFLALDAATGKTRFQRSGICLAPMGASSAPGVPNPVGLGDFFLMGPPVMADADHFYRLDPRSWRYVTTYPVSSDAQAATSATLITGLVTDIGRETLQAADIARGTPLWSVPLPSSPSQAQALGGLFTVAIDGGAMAIDLRSGKTAWTYYIRDRDEAQVLTCAHFGGSVFLGVDGAQDVPTREDKSSRVMSLDSRTGNVRWSARMHTTPIPLPAGDAVFTLVGGESIYALDAATGRTKWIYPVDGQVFLVAS